MPPRINSEEKKGGDSKYLRDFKTKYSYDCGIPLTEWMEDNYGDAADAAGWTLQSKMANMILYVKKGAKAILKPKYDGLCTAPNWDTFKENVVKVLQGPGWAANVYAALHSSSQEHSESV